MLGPEVLSAIREQIEDKLADDEARERETSSRIKNRQKHTINASTQRVFVSNSRLDPGCAIPHLI